MATLAELSIPIIKKTLRACNISPQEILKAKTKDDLLQLGALHGLVQVPDSWRMKQYKEERRREEAKTAKLLTLEGIKEEGLSLSSFAESRHVPEGAPAAPSTGQRPRRRPQLAGAQSPASGAPGFGSPKKLKDYSTKPRVSRTPAASAKM